MAGTVTKTEETYGTIRKITFDWASSSGGAADATTTNAFSGQLLNVYCVPDSGGTAPTALYDVVLNNADGVDLLHGLGADNSATVTSAITNALGGLGAVANDKLTLGVTNAGDTKGGIVYVFIR